MPVGRFPAESFAAAESTIMRYAIYYTPPRDAALTRAAAAWLGRDVFAGEAVPHPQAGRLSLAELAFHTAAARRYGFHATLKAPFQLAPGCGEGELIAAFHHFASGIEPLVLPRVEARVLSGFIAIVPSDRDAALDHLAGEAVRIFEPFRAPMTDADFLRRNPENLTPNQIKHLQMWGYPYVFDEFRFHMTLTGRVDEGEREKLMSAARGYFSAHLDRPLEIASIALFVEPEPGAPFVVRAFSGLGRQSARKTA